MLFYHGATLNDTFIYLLVTSLIHWNFIIFQEM